MSVKFNLKSGDCNSSCVSKDGCSTDRCPDFTIRRHDTRPFLKISVEDCDGPFDSQGLVVEVNMWALAKLKTEISETDEYFRLADDIGFNQVMVGDIIVFDRVRLPERMLVVGFDETNKLIKVQRGYHGTNPSVWEKGQLMRIFRVLNAPAQAEIEYEDIRQVDGTLEENVIVGSYLVYEWQPEDTCLPGCYWLEFKVLKMIDIVWYLPGGNWSGERHKHTDGFFYTGTTHSESSVVLSFNQIDNLYYLPSVPWSGEFHLYTDGNYYTGDSHNDGSVFLSKTDIPSDDNVSYDEEGVSSLADTSIIPSFTNENLTPSDFGCILGEGVEWVRRFPINEEGFLIKVTNSPTQEL